MSNSFLSLDACGEVSGVVVTAGARGPLSQATQRLSASRQTLWRSNGKGGRAETEVFKGHHPL